MESVHIAANKNTVPGDVSAMVPGGIRMGRGFLWITLCFQVQGLHVGYLWTPTTSGTPALTSRGFVEEDFVKVAEFFDAAVGLAVKIKAETKGDRFYQFILLCADYTWFKPPNAIKHA